MSQHIEVSYVLEKKERERIENEQIKNTTIRYYQEYLKTYNEFLSSDDREFITEELKRLKNDLDNIEKNISENPRLARDISFEIGRYIYNLKTIARNARERFILEEKIRIEKEAILKTERQNALFDEFNRCITEISNPAIYNFANNELKKIKEEIFQDAILDINVLNTKINYAIKEAGAKLAEWKEEKLKENRLSIIKEKIENIKDQLKSSSIEEKVLLEKRLNELANNLDENIDNEINDIQKEIDQTIIDENIRREAVRAVVKQLKSQGFTVSSNIMLVKNEKENYVKLHASMPSGKKAICNLTSDGKLIYKFDGYDGMTCLNDLTKFKVDLERIYSIKLSDEKVLWSNPDEIGKDADKLPTSYINEKG